MANLTPNFAIAIHGGAGRRAARAMGPALRRRYERALARALDAGAAVLERGGASVDAVCAAVVELEDCGLFNAGRGAAANAEGEHELDASVMDGRTRAAGGVAAARRIRNPVLAARAVMEKSPHVLLAGRGADAFAARGGLSLVSSRYYVRRLSRSRSTVGAVARDRHGNLAAATSTGGTSGKLPGRVGDSPIVGAGTFADNGLCAVSGTGLGEAFIRAALAYDIAARMRYRNESLASAARQALATVARLGGDGGLVAVDRQGRIVMPFNSDGMHRASLAGAGRRSIAILE